MTTTYKPRHAKPMTVDEVITEVTEVPGHTEASQVMRAIRSRQLLLAVADQLYIDPEGHSSDWLRKAIVTEARA